MEFAQILSMVLSGFIAMLCLVCWIRICIRAAKNKYASVKTVKAVVADKYKTKTLSRVQGSFKRERCVVVFGVSGKKLAFDVSEFSYNRYKIKEKGTLKYKGSRIIEFG